MKRLHSRKKHIITIVCCVIAVTAIGVGAFFGAKSIYTHGVEDGRTEIEAEYSDRISALGKAVGDKNSFQDTINRFTAELPDTINAEAIDKYIEAMEGIRNEITDSSIGDSISSYIDKWKEFKEEYASQDNEAIEEQFNALKTTASDLTKQIKTQFDDSIKAAIEAL